MRLVQGVDEAGASPTPCAGRREVREELQAALVKSEEGRLEVSKVLIELEMEYTRTKEEADAKSHKLEERVLQLEAEQLARTAAERQAQRRPLRLAQPQPQLHAPRLEGRRWPRL